MSITAGLTATKAALEIAKLAMDKLNTPSVDVHAVRASVQELLIHVVNAQVALGEANVEISELRQQLADREALKAIEADMQYEKDGGFFIQNSTGAVCCPACWGDKKVVAMAHLRNNGYKCAKHDGVYRRKSSLEQEERDDASVAIITPRHTQWS